MNFITYVCSLMVFASTVSAQLRLISSRGKGNGQNEHRIKESRGDKSIRLQM
jgi:hypothetical protein